MMETEQGQVFLGAVQKSSAEQAPRMDPSDCSSEEGPNLQSIGFSDDNTNLRSLPETESKKSKVKDDGVEQPSQQQRLQGESVSQLKEEAPPQLKKETPPQLIGESVSRQPNEAPVSQPTGETLSQKPEALSTYDHSRAQKSTTKLQTQSPQGMETLPSSATSSTTNTICSEKELDWSFLESGRVYGRDSELHLLQQAFERRLACASGARISESNRNTSHGSLVSYNSNKSSNCSQSYSASSKRKHFTRKGNGELLLVSGKSGTGKTVLVKKALKELVEDYDGHFLMGKFDQLQATEPYAPFCAALTQLVLALEQANFRGIDELRQRLEEHLGLDGCRVICALVPAFTRILGSEHQQSTTTWALSAQQDRLQVALKKLFQVICSPDEPIVLVLDDLQWGDPSSFHVLGALVSDTEVTDNGLIFVGVCRDNEVPWEHQFANMLRKLEDEKSTQIIHVQVKGLPVDATLELLSDMLHQPQEMCQQLAELLHKETGGNALFMLQYLKAMRDEGVLVAEQRQCESLSASSLSWFQHHFNKTSTTTKTDKKGNTVTKYFQWLLFQDQWQEKFENVSVVDLVRFQLNKLPDSCQRLLKVGACMGNVFDSTVLSKIMEAIDVQEALRSCVAEHLIEPETHGSPGMYKFTHDRIQQASYSLIPEDELPFLHMTIGRSMLQESQNSAENLFLTTNQLLLGIPLLSNQNDKNGLARLCLQAGQKAFKSNDYQKALSYFSSGTGLLARRHWRDEYHLSLDLFNARAEAESRCGEIAKMEATIQEIAANCRSPNDKITSDVTRIYSFGSRAMLRESMEVSLQLLAKLGVKFPAKPRVVYLISNMMRVKRLLKNKTDQELLSLPPVDIADKQTTAALMILHYSGGIVYCCDKALFPFFILRLMKLTLKHGLSDVASVAFSLYGMLLCATGDIEEAYRFCQLGLQMLDRFPATKYLLLPRVHFFVYAVVSPWKEPIRFGLDKLTPAISAGMDSGDHEVPVYTAYTQLIELVFAGEPLPNIAERLEQYNEFIKHYRWGPWLRLTLLLQQFLMNFMNKTDKQLLTAIKLNKEDSNRGGVDQDFELLESTLLCNQLILSYHMESPSEAYSYVTPVIKTAQSRAVFTNVIQSLYASLAALNAAHYEKKKRRRAFAIAKKSIKKLEKLEEHGSGNFFHMIYLLKGEVELLKGNLMTSLAWYQKAWERANLTSFLQLEALAYERAAIVHQRLGNGPSCSEAIDLMQKAVERYTLWGGKAVVKRLKKEHTC